MNLKNLFYNGQGHKGNDMKPRKLVLTTQPSQAERETARAKKQEAAAEAAKRRIKAMMGNA